MTEREITEDLKSDKTGFTEKRRRILLDMRVNQTSTSIDKLCGNWLKCTDKLGYNELYGTVCICLGPNNSTDFVIIVILKSEYDSTSIFSQPTID